MTSIYLNSLIFVDTMDSFVISISLSFIQDESDEPELGDVAVAHLTVISDNDTSPVHYQPVKISVVIESDIVVSLPRLADAFLVMFGLG